MKFALNSSALFLCFVYLCVNSNAKRFWDYELLSFSVESSDENLINATISIDRHKLSRRSFSGVVDWKYDCDKNTRTQMKMFWSRSGRDEDFHELPYAVPNITLYEYLDHYYMKQLYPELASCSNMPSFKKFVPPWNKTTYVFSHCEPEGVNVPEVLPRGYYKVELQIVGLATLIYRVLVKLTPKGIM